MKTPPTAFVTDAAEDDPVTDSPVPQRNATTFQPIFDDNFTIIEPNGNFTGNSTAPGFDFWGFITSNFSLPMWATLAIAFLVFIIWLCCMIMICRKCCCKDKKPKKKNRASDKQPLMEIGGDLKGGVGGGGDKDDEAQSEASEKYLGRLHYSFDYDMVKQELMVAVIEAADVPALDDGGTSDPYVKLCLLPDKKKFKTKVISKSLNPVFNETFTFKIPFADAAEKVMEFSVYDHDKFSKDDMIGYLKIALKDLDMTTVTEQWSELTDPIKDDSEAAALGDICFTLHYVPATGKLTLIVLECKNLKKMGMGELANSYVKLDLYRGSKRHRKKKTSIREKTLNPYFNESFVFDVPPDQIYLISLDVTVMHRSNKIGARPEAIGHIKLSSGVTGTELRHWTDMLRNPRRPVAQWHPLQELTDE